VIGEIRLGIEYNDPTDSFSWQITLVPAGKYHRIDDHVWNLWKTGCGANLPPESAHRDKTNTVRFVLRPVSPEMTAEVAFNDAKRVLEFMLTSDASLAEAVGFDPDDD